MTHREIRYRGQHRANRFSIGIVDLLAEHDWHLPGQATVLRSLLSVDSLSAHVARGRLPYASELAALNIQYATQMAALGFGPGYRASFSVGAH